MAHTVGLSNKYDAAFSQIDAWVEDAVVPGAGAAIWRRGAIVAEHYTGEARPGVPVTAETLFGLASISKPITAAAVISCVESGDLALDAPLALFVPEFGDPETIFQEDAIPQLEALRDRITIEQLLCHVSGLPENIGVRHLRISEQPTLATMLDTMTALPLKSAPGEQLRYSNVGYGLLALAVERATGDDFFTVLRKRVLEPFNLQDVIVKPDDAQRQRIAHTRDTAGEGTPSESYNSTYWQDLAIPWGGYYGTPVALAKYASSFLPGHERGLRLESMRAMRKDHTGGVPGGVESAGVRWEHGAWGYGWEVKADKKEHWTGTKTTVQTFCHWGQAGTLVWADPYRELAFAVFANRTVMQQLWSLKPARWAMLSDTVVQLVDDLR